MPLDVVTHSGPFHADDVLAVALLRRWIDPAATVTRTRDPARIARADVVVDVGGVYDPATRRFDHHQATYTGPRSAAGLVLEWLHAEGHLPDALFQVLDDRLVRYVDAVDNGRVAPRPDVPCYARLVEVANHGNTSFAAFDVAFEDATTFAAAWLRGLVAGYDEERAADATVVAAMADAVARGSTIVELPRHLRWKPAYFAHGGAAHPTTFVVFPGLDGLWQAVAIPPEEDRFDQKVSLPAAWAGLVDDALVAASGIPGARFCHKNRFIAVFESRDATFAGLAAAGVR